jgi:hypothetical protein
MVTCHPNAGGLLLQALVVSPEKVKPKCVGISADCNSRAKCPPAPACKNLFA